MKAIMFKLLCIGLYVLLVHLCAGYLVCYHIKGDFEYSKLMNFKISSLRHATSPKIIVIGGSNTIYGIECRKLSESTGYSVVNLGFNAMTGIRFSLETLRPYLSKDDIVLLSPEYENFFSDNIYYGNDTVAFLAIKNIKFLSPYYLSSLQQLYSIFWRLPYIAFKYFYNNILGKSTASEVNYDGFGDMQITDITFSGKSFDDKVIISPQGSFNNTVVKDLLQYQKSALSKGARLIIAYPYLPEDTYKINRTKLDLVHHKLISAGLEIMAPPSESYAAKIYFNDTIYHPNPVGRIIRTDSITYWIKKHINQ